MEKDQIIILENRGAYSGDEPSIFSKSSLSDSTIFKHV